MSQFVMLSADGGLITKSSNYILWAPTRVHNRRTPAPLMFNGIDFIIIVGTFYTHQALIQIK